MVWTRLKVCLYTASLSFLYERRFDARVGLLYMAGRMWTWASNPAAQRRKSVKTARWFAIIQCSFGLLMLQQWRTDGRTRRISCLLVRGITFAARNDVTPSTSCLLSSVRLFRLHGNLWRELPTSRTLWSQNNSRSLVHFTYTVP